MVRFHYLFFTEALSEAYAQQADPIMAAFESNNDAELGRAVRVAVEHYIDLLKDEHDIIVERAV